MCFIPVLCRLFKLSPKDKYLPPTTAFKLLYKYIPYSKIVVQQYLKLVKTFLIVRITVEHPTFLKFCIIPSQISSNEKNKQINKQTKTKAGKRKLQYAQEVLLPLSKTNRSFGTHKF